jgi:hypothetical protein
MAAIAFLRRHNSTMPVASNELEKDHPGHIGHLWMRSEEAMEAHRHAIYAWNVQVLVQAIQGKMHNNLLGHPKFAIGEHKTHI